MLKRIRLENFKAIKFLDFQCARLNLLTGLNGSGKSSFIQFLSFLRTYARKDIEPYRWYSYREIGLPGRYGDIRYCYAKDDDPVRFHVDFEAKENFAWQEGEAQSGSLDRVIYYDECESDDIDVLLVVDQDVYEREMPFINERKRRVAAARSNGVTHTTKPTEDIVSQYRRHWKYVESVKLREKKIQSAYQNVWDCARIVDAFRCKPTDVHIGSGKYGSMEDATQFDSVFDPEGGDAVEFLYKFGRIVKLDQANPMIYPGSRLHEREFDIDEEDLLIAVNPGAYFMDDPLKYEHEEERPLRKYTTLSEQVNAWLNVVSPGARLDVSRQIVGDAELYSATVGFGEMEYARTFRPQNVGLGISYVLPVLVTILTARPTDIIVIENPEAHIHPKGQSEIGKLLARAAAYGVQVFVETHSDHVINGIRVAVKKGILPSNDVHIEFFDRHRHKVRYADGVREEYYADIYDIKIDKNGMLSNYPRGFLDEWDNQYYQLNS